MGSQIWAHPTSAFSDKLMDEFVCEAHRCEMEPRSVLLKYVVPKEISERGSKGGSGVRFSRTLSAKLRMSRERILVK